MQMWRNLRKCQEWQSRLTTYKRYCITNGMTSALSFGNGGGKHLVCCAPVILLTKSAILAMRTGNRLLPYSADSKFIVPSAKKKFFLKSWSSSHLGVNSLEYNGNGV